MKQAFALIAAVVAIFASDPALGRDCTNEEAYAAEMATDNLLAWKDVYEFYTEFRHCYDGAIAEGTEDKVQLLWATHWNTLPEMIALTNKDPGFKSLMWQIARSEAFSQDTFNVVLRSASRKCPKSAVEFCRVIKAAARGRMRPNPSLKLSTNGVSRWSSGARPSAHFAPAAQRATPLAPA